MEGALLATARFVADKAAILFQLDEKLKAMSSIEEKMENLKELSTIIDMVIEDVESHTLNKDAVKELLRKLKYLAYDLEDVVDCYDTEALRRQRPSMASSEPVRDFFSSNNQVLFTSRISDMIQAVTNSLDSILRQKSFLPNWPQSISRMSPCPYRETHSRNSFVVIGREPEKNVIVDSLTKDDDDDDDENSHGTLKVITIVGMGGLGKTTLAQLVFNDEGVKAHFGSSRMWTVVGAVFDPAKIMKSVLELATDAPVNISEIDLVRQKLEKTLSGKKFLLVLDDVWNEDELRWSVLKAALTCGARGSKILVTTRNQQVSSITDSSYSHQIKQLSLPDCLFLFQKFAFGDKEVDRTLMEIGGKIVKKCGGVPLAAISLGSMLRITRDETYWSSVLQSEIWQLGNEEDKVLAVLKLSYDSLPRRSKKCFAFGSLFSKNHMMQKDELIKLWIANGFVRSEGNFDAETAANRVFDDLVLRSFFLLAPFQDVTRCTMHDLMHDLARSVSADVYWNSKQDSAKEIGKRTYHLHMDTDFEDLRNSIRASSKKPLYLRTLTLNYFRLNADQLEFVFSELKFLRVLNLSYNGIREVPTSIGILIHLRYLNLSGNNIEVLPDSITLLPNLQYLNLSFNRELQELPKDLGSMQSLRDLDCRRRDLFRVFSESDFRSIHMPCGLSRLTNLRSLPAFVAGDRTGACSILELEDLKLHGEMRIKFSKNFKNYSCGGRKILKNKHLNKLCLEFNRSESNDKDMLDDLRPNTSLKKLAIWNYWSRQFPAWLMESQLPNLVEVCLTYCRGCKQIPAFGNLQLLKKLVLDLMDGITQMGAEFHGHGGFPSLQELYLNRMNNLEEWSEAHGADQLFPSLQKLKIVFCPTLKSMPRLPRIQELEIACCNGSLLSCVGRLTSLSVLKVEEMSNMPFLPSELQRIKMIRSLTTDSCNSLIPLPLEMGRLSSLSYLQLTGCASIIILQPEELVQILNSVREFQIEICSKKVNLHGQMQHLHTLKELFITGAHSPCICYSYIDRNNTTQLSICCCGDHELESWMTAEPASSTVLLEQLYIDGISNLATLPDWLQHLESLRFLSIANCPRLGLLPRGLKNLRLLETLTIIDCPQLRRRCERETGEDWPIISHLPHFFTV